MFVYGNIKSFFVKIIIGVFLSLFSVFILISLFTHNDNDPGYGIIGDKEIIMNWAGFFGAYTSSIMFVFLGKSSYLFPAFILVIALKFLLGFKNKLVLLKTLFFILGIIFLNLSLTFLKIKSGFIGSFAYLVLYSYLSSYLQINIFYWLLFVFLFVCCFVFLFLSLDFKIKFLNKLLLPIKYIKYFFFPFIYIFSTLKKSNKQNLGVARILKTKNKRSEPKLKRNIFASKNFKKKDSFASDVANKSQYILPPLNLLKNSEVKSGVSKDIQKQSVEFSFKLEKILSEYGVEGKIVNYKYGPVVTLYEFLPAAGIKTSKVIGLSEDITRAMSSLSTRISLQPGKTSLGIEIPNAKREEVLLGDLIKDEYFFANKEGLTLALGKNISGEKVFTDLEKMPHLLIAGTTGSGKSVGINSMIMSLLFKFSPSECKLILIDPKMLELSVYEDIPHLLTPVVTNPNKAVFALKWVVNEMENRYRLMSSLNVKNIKSFNSKISSALSAGKKLTREVQTGIDSETKMPIIEKKEIDLKKMPLIVVVIDEMADLMMVAGKEVENLVQRLAQMARASGIHLITATQRPSVDVITGTIKANFPSRISFRVASRFDSRTILNEMGAEQLLGSGDMLFLENGSNLNRLHGGFISESEIEKVVNHIKSQSTFESLEDITLEQKNHSEAPGFVFENKNVDELYDKAIEIILQQQKVSTSFIQRYLQIGYNRAARIVEKMEEDGFISEPNNAGKRSVLKKNR